jgi:hypothetical protein
MALSGGTIKSFSQKLVLNDKIELIAMSTGLIAILTHSLFSYPFYIAPILFVFSLVLARVVQLNQKIQVESNDVIVLHETVRPVIFISTIGILGLLSLFIALGMGLNQYYIKKAELQVRHDDISHATKTLVTAQKFWPYQQRATLLALQLDAKILTSLANSLPKLRSMVYQHAMQEFSLLQKINPYNSNAFFYRGLLAEYNPSATTIENNKIAEKAFRYRLYLDRRNVAIRVSYAKLLLTQNRMALANTILNEALAMALPANESVLHYYEYTRKVMQQQKDEYAVIKLDNVITRVKNILQSN